MKPPPRLVWVAVGLTILILVIFALWGEAFTRWFSPEGSAAFFAEHPAAAGLIGVGLLVSDLALPIPTTGVIGGMGAALGTLPGFAWGWLGLSLAGLVGYALARLGGERWANRLATPEEQIRYRRWFDRWGGLAVVLSRMLPILPEVFSVLAGLYGMQARRFGVAVTLGSLPPALVFAWLGAQAREHPGPALWAMVAVMALAWLVFDRMQKRGASETSTADEPG